MRKGFTLVELIFVIVIIGILAAVAVPKFKDLKQNAEVSGTLKIASDAFAGIPGSYVNKVDLESNTSNVTLKDLVSVSGKGWNLEDANLSYKDGANTVVTLKYYAADRNASLLIDCTKFSDASTQTKCGKVNESNTTAQTIDF